MDRGIPNLRDEQIEELGQIAENAARKHIFSKVNQKMVENLNISVEAEGAKPACFSVEVELELLPDTQQVNEKELAAEGVKAAFNAIEAYLRKLP